MVPVHRLEIEPHGVFLLCGGRNLLDQKPTGDAYVSFTSEAMAAAAALRDKGSVGDRIVEVVQVSDLDTVPEKILILLLLGLQERPLRGYVQVRPSHRASSTCLQPCTAYMCQAAGSPFHCGMRFLSLFCFCVRRAECPTSHQGETEIHAFFSPLAIVGLYLCKEALGRNTGDAYVEFSNADFCQQA